MFIHRCIITIGESMPSRSGIFTGCNIAFKTSIAEGGKLHAPKDYLPCWDFHCCPAMLLNKGELHYKASAQNFSYRAGQVRNLI